MARPTNKDELINLSSTNFEKLFNIIDSLSEEEQNLEFNFEDRDKNIRDVLIHLHEWHLMMQRWYKEGMNDLKPDIPAKGYTWKTTKDLNYEIWKKYQNIDLKTSKKLLKESHENIMETIKSHSNDELFTKKLYKWTGTTSLGSYLISATSSHYDWAIKKIKKHIKEIKNNK